MNSPEASPSISLLKFDELDAAVRLLTKQLEEHDIPTSAAVLRDVVKEVVSNPTRGFLLLATVNDREVGLAFVAAHLSAEHGGNVGWLEEFYVAPLFRSRGIGSLLLKEVVERARKAGWRGLDLEVVAGHERAISVYLRSGFGRVDRTRFHCNLA